MSRLRRVLDPTRTDKDAELLEKTLLKLVVGQKEAVEQIVNIYQMDITGGSALGRPVGNFLFLGPTVSGKTRTVEASDALKKLLLGVLDKATLTLADNRKVDFSRTMIFLTSNLESGEIGAQEFIPELMNSMDRVVMFKPLGGLELRRVLELELDHVRRRIAHSSIEKPFFLSVSEGAKNFMLSEGADVRYGAGSLKRAIERLLVVPLSNLIATRQVKSGDRVEAGFDAQLHRLLFTKKAGGWRPANGMRRNAHAPWGRHE
jgi:ATP-dependent Clp protease ATP-binding subunit ClpA